MIEKKLVRVSIKLKRSLKLRLTTPICLLKTT